MSHYYKNNYCDEIEYVEGPQGPRGYNGPKGCPGDRGNPGPPGDNGVEPERAFASVIKNDITIALPKDAPLTFTTTPGDTISPYNMITTSGAITVIIPGTYEFYFYVRGSPTNGETPEQFIPEPIRVAIAVNGSLVSNYEFRSDSYEYSTQSLTPGPDKIIEGKGILSLSSGDVITLVNKTYTNEPDTTAYLNLFVKILATPLPPTNIPCVIFTIKYVGPTVILS